MINTHKKTFKFRTMIQQVIKMAIIMNIAMVFVQTTMIIQMALRMTENFFIYNEHHAVQKNMIGNAVILLWFFFDSIGNLIQMYIGAHLLEWSGAICNDVQMHHLENQGEI